MFYRIGMNCANLEEHYRQCIWENLNIYDHIPTELEIMTDFYKQCDISVSYIGQLVQINVWIEEYVENNYHQILGRTRVESKHANIISLIYEYCNDTLLFFKKISKKCAQP